MSGRVVHFEIPFDDGDRARRFYADVFGWQVMQLPEMQYTLVTTGPADPETGPTEPGYINGGMFERTDDFPSTGPNLVIGVDDIDEALKKAEAAGGTIVNERQAVGDLGFSAYFKDTEGNFIGLWENAR
jgi:hypothetical protein